MAFGFLKRKKKQEEKDSRFVTLTIKDVVNVAQDAVNVVFEKPKGFDYKPGQFITIVDTVNGEKLRRAYSLCTTPYLDEDIAVTVKRVPGGKMSNHINDNFKAGQSVEIMEPMGKFTTTYSNDIVRKAIFFGGGSGITPLYAIARTVLDQENFSKVAIVYGNRSEEHIIFKNELQALESEFSHRFQLVHILNDDPNGLTHHHGIPTTEMIGEILSEIDFGQTAEYFVCGPQPMMDVVRDGLIRADVPTDKIMMESFTPGVTSPEDMFDAPDAPAAKGVGSAVTFVYAGEETTVDVPEGKPVLEAGLDKNIDLPYSCQSGLCTACRGKCVEGKVSLDDAHGLTDAEKESGYVLMCVGKALTDKVKIEVG